MPFHYNWNVIVIAAVHRILQLTIIALPATPAFSFSRHSIQMYVLRRFVPFDRSRPSILSLFQIRHFIFLLANSALKAQKQRDVTLTG